MYPTFSTRLLALVFVPLLGCGGSPTPPPTVEPDAPAEAPEDAPFTMRIDAWEDNGPIPADYALCIPADEGHVQWGPNKNPAITWSDAPDGTLSFAVITNDIDAPTVGDDVNKEGKTIPAELPRTVFTHWILVDLPADATGIAAGADSDGFTEKGKPAGATEHGVRGVNDYTGWFASNPDLAGQYAGYDGPCPPWNDSIAHRYQFTVYALDKASLELEADFARKAFEDAIEGHVLAEASWMGTYLLNPDATATKAPAPEKATGGD